MTKDWKVLENIQGLLEMTTTKLVYWNSKGTLQLFDSITRTCRASWIDICFHFYESLNYLRCLQHITDRKTLFPFFSASKYITNSKLLTILEVPGFFLKISSSIQQSVFIVSVNDNNDHFNLYAGLIHCSREYCGWTLAFQIFDSNQAGKYMLHFLLTFIWAGLVCYFVDSMKKVNDNIEMNRTWCDSVE